MGNTQSTDTTSLIDALNNLPARTHRAESSYIGPNLSFLDQKPVIEPEHVDSHYVYHVVFLLRQKLIPDVIPLILHYAEIFEHQTFEVEDQVSTHIGHSRYFDCLKTEAIRSRARIKCPVRRIIFEIESREVVWERRDGSCCWTRFTAGIDPPKDKRMTDEEALILKRGGLINEREIGRHDSALRDIKTYMLEWSVDSENKEEREWVRSLCNGDQIVVRAAALYSGFVNKIHDVRVALYMGAVA